MTVQGYMYIPTFLRFIAKGEMVILLHVLDSLPENASHSTTNFRSFDGKN